MTKKCRFCGRTKSRNEMSIKELNASKAWCAAEISKIKKQIEKKKAEGKNETSI